MRILDYSEGLSCVEKRSARRWYLDGREETEDKNVIVEHLLSVYINEQMALELVCTPKDLCALVVGHLLSEQRIESVDEIEAIHLCESGATAKVFLTHAIPKIEKTMEIRSCNCGADGILGRKWTDDVENKDETENLPAFSKEEILAASRELMEAFQNGGKIHQMSGGTHSAFLYYQGNVMYEAEDIGRHNALDKVIGMAALDHIDLKQCMIFTSGRVPLDMINKIIRMKIPVLFSNAVPSNLALEAAKKTHTLLYTTARKGGMDQIF